MERKWMVNEVPKNKLANAVIVKIKPSSKVVITQPNGTYFLQTQLLFTF